MSRRRRRVARNSAPATVIALVIMCVLGVVYLVTGQDPSGIFKTADTALPEVATLVNPPSGATPGSLTPQPPVSGAWWEVYFTDPVKVKDPAKWQDSVEGRLIEKINTAKSSIHIASFEFDLTLVAEALVKARQRGVDVRWVTDDEHGLEADIEPGHGQFAMLEQKGIEVRSDARSALMHNKFWIFDGRTVWTGSTNVTLSGVYQQNNNAVVIHSREVAAIYEREFAEMWDGQYGPRSPSTAEQQSAVVNGNPIQVYFSPEDEVMDRIIPVVRGAQSSIRFMAFSFTDYPLAQAMIDRAGAGVDVAGVYEKVGSGTEGSELRTFFCARVPVRQDGNPRFLHHKLIVLDNRYVITGSFNFSSNATENNDENVVIIDNPQIASLYLQEFERVWALAADPDPAQLPCE
ncbi:MAG TPA: phospholipase D-like domain-containing protein [Anaerolineales bacterium]|nr:phospholipase D-like domain-containing protein [Anaerolineales bacterium]